jgi:DNA-binding HxlR family transcriptional regulator
MESLPKHLRTKHHTKVHVLSPDEMGCSGLTFNEVGTSKLRESLKTRDTDILKLPQTLFNPYRILILRALAISGEADFRELRYALKGTTDGNLASHLNALKTKGYIESRRRKLEHGKSLTSFKLTVDGIRAFDEFHRLLAEVTEIAR